MATSPYNDASSSDDTSSEAISGGDRVAEYLPISSDGDEDLSDTEGGGGYFATHSNGRDIIHSVNRHSPSHPHLDMNGMVSSLDLEGIGRGEAEAEEEEEEEEEREASIRRAFTEDERRRAAPLTRENAARVMEAMRGVSFRGLAPDWAVEVPEERWVSQLQRLRREVHRQGNNKEFKKIDSGSTEKLIGMQGVVFLLFSEE